jgi:hypothetical protein
MDKEEDFIIVKFPEIRAQELIAARLGIEVNEVDTYPNLDHSSTLMEAVNETLVIYAAVARETKKGADLCLERKISPDEKDIVIPINGRRRNTIEISFLDENSIHQGPLKLKSAWKTAMEENPPGESQKNIWRLWASGKRLLENVVKVIKSQPQIYLGVNLRRDMVQALLEADSGSEVDLADFERKFIRTRMQEIIDSAFEIYLRVKPAAHQGLNAYLWHKGGSRIPLFVFNPT